MKNETKKIFTSKEVSLIAYCITTAIKNYKERLAESIDKEFWEKKLKNLENQEEGIIKKLIESHN